MVAIGLVADFKSKVIENAEVQKAEAEQDYIEAGPGLAVFRMTSNAVAAKANQIKLGFIEVTEKVAEAAEVEPIVVGVDMVDHKRLVEAAMAADTELVSQMAELDLVASN